MWLFEGGEPRGTLILNALAFSLSLNINEKINAD